MRVVLVAGALALLIALGVGVLVAINVRALVAAHRDDLLARARRVLDRPLTVAAVEPSLWPPGARLTGVVVGADPMGGGGVLLEAEAVIVAVRPWPLLRGRIEAAGLVLERPRMTLVRDAAGDWNVASVARVKGRGPRGSPGRHGPRVSLPWTVGVAVTEVRDGTLELRDEQGEPPRRLVARHVRIRARDVRLGGSARVRVDAAVFSDDGRPDTQVDLHLSNLGAQGLGEAPFELEAEIRDASLNALGAVLGRQWPRAGQVERLAIAARGTPARFTARVEAQVGRVTFRPYPGGRGLTLPAASVRVELRRRTRTLALDGLHGTIGTLALAGRGTIDLASWRTRLRLASAPGSAVDLAQGTVPLRLTEVGGRLDVDGGGARLAAGRVVIEGIPLAVSGRLRGFGPAVLEAQVLGGAFGGALTGDARASTTTGTLEGHVRFENVSLAALAARVAPGLAERVEGEASGSLAVTTRLPGDVARDEALAGHGVVTITRARIHDLNLPGRLLASLDAVPFLPSLVRNAAEARYPEVFAARDTVIDAATIPFVIADGRLSSEHFTSTGGTYEITGHGWLDLARRIRVHGDLRLSRPVSVALREEVPALRRLQCEDGRLTVPFRLRGRLGEAEPQPDFGRLRAHGLEMLRDARIRRPRSKAGDAKGRGRRIEDEVLDRLERMIGR
jgi:AsmA-like C-terminal region